MMDWLSHALRLLGVTERRGRLAQVPTVPLRLFLGGTFLYAGLQKLTDPQFFSPTAPGFIGRQMSGFVHTGSPLSPLLTHLAIPHPAQFGALIALCEVWAGLAALLGLLTRVGALGGLGLSLTLYLTATWTVHPYFLGADLPYAMGWLTVLLAGPDRYCLDLYLFGRIAGARCVPVEGTARRKGKQLAPLPLDQDPVARAAFLRGLGTAGVVATGGGVVAALAKLATPNRVFARQSAALVGSAPAGGTAPTSAAGAGARAPAGYTFLGNVKVLPANSAGMYTDPITGDPGILVHLPGGQFVAYDAVCTHAGCTVEYDPSQRLLVCPCHGATYDPAHGAQVLAGPAPQPLAPLQVSIDAKGNAYARGSAGSESQPATPNGGQ